MRRTANCLVTTSLVLAGALVVGPLHAADLDTASQVDAVTVYPDGASVTRVITLDLPAGDNTLIAKDFPMGLDPSSLRVEGDAGAKLRKFGALVKAFVEAENTRITEVLKAIGLAQ